MGVARGPEGKGAPGLPCSTCHGTENLPASYGADAPPGAPNWHLPPPDHKMAWIGLSPARLCETIKSKRQNGGRDFEALTKHVSEDSLVLWGWHPGGNRLGANSLLDTLVFGRRSGTHAAAYAREQKTPEVSDRKSVV